jgi:tetratricopeptide (TPR) repeat protein
MRRIIYLVIFLVLLITGSLLLRKYYQSVPVPSIFTATEKGEENKSMISNYLSGTVAQQTGDTRSAIKYFEAALLKDPENPEIIKRLYVLSLFNGEYETAIRHAKRVQQIDIKNQTKPEDIDSIAYLLIALSEFGTKDKVLIPSILEPLLNVKKEKRTHLDGVVIPMVLAWSYVVQEDYTNAFKVIDGITTEYMLSVFSYNRALINDLAHNKTILYEGKNYTLEEKSKKFLADIFFEMGQFSLQNKNLNEAVIYLRLARYLDSKSYKLKRMLGVTFEAMGKLEDAVSIYREVPESSENYGDTLLSIALAEYRLGENEKSIKSLQKLQSMKGFEYQAAFGMGSIKMAENKHEEAIKYFETAKAKIEKETPDNWNLYFNLGVSYEKLGDWDKAEANLKKSVELYPQNPESLNYLAYSWLIRNKNIKQARAMLEAAVIKSGGAPHILDSYGWALYKLGFFKEAIPFLEQATSAMPYSVVINDHLGDAYWKVGRKREAKYQWQKALDVFEKDTDITPEVSKEFIQHKIDTGI